MKKIFCRLLMLLAAGLLLAPAFAAGPPADGAYTVEVALSAAKESNYEIPLHLRNAPTDLMKKLGYHKGYKYPHDYDRHFVKEQYLPDELKVAEELMKIGESEKNKEGTKKS